jgi:hypothetical protein
LKVSYYHDFKLTNSFIFTGPGAEESGQNSPERIIKLDESRVMKMQEAYRQEYHKDFSFDITFINSIKNQTLS